jgi:thiamine biosynthesis lipoprotein
MRPAELDEVIALATALRMPKGMAVLEQGEAAKNFFVLLSGRLKVVKTTPDGKQVVVRFVALYQDDSALVELNRTSVLVSPAPEFVDLLRLSQKYAELSNGAFDPTVQPLWELYAEHFSKENADPNGPSEAAVKAAVARVGLPQATCESRSHCPHRRRGSDAERNCTGYVTDKVVDLLREEGVDHSLVDIGETRVIGTYPGGRSWEVAIEDPDEPSRIAAVLPLVDRAAATSGAYGFRFEPTGRFNHLFNPATGACACLYRSVTTVARSATAADALSTAFSLVSQDRIQSVMRAAGIPLVYLIEADGKQSQLEA